MTKDNNPRELIKKVRAAEARGMIEEAVGYMRQLVQEIPLDGRAWCRLGMLLTKLGKKREEGCLQDRSIGHADDDIGPVSADLHAYWEYSEAEEAFQRCLALEPIASVYVLLGIMQAEQGRDPDAEVSFKKALELDPNWDEAMANLAQLYLPERPEEAEELLRRALMIDPNVAAYHRELASALFLQSKVDEVEPLYRKALELDPNDWETYVHLGNELLRQRHYPEAEALYNRACELEPSLASLPHVFLGNICLRADRLEEAERHYRTAIELQPDLPDAMHALGAFLCDHGDKAEAARWLRKYLVFDPDCGTKRAGRVRRWLAELEG